MSVIASSPTSTPQARTRSSVAALADAPAEALPALEATRATARGKFLLAGDSKLYLKGVTYGPFGPDGCSREYGEPAQAGRDFAQIAAAGINSLRVYTVPPTWLLDAAAEHGLRVMVGLPWEQHVAFLSDRRRGDDIRRRVAAGVAACAGHPAVLALAVGNEIPAPVVRWYGHRRVERYLRSLYDAAKSADPGALVTYVNYPTTEYLELPFLDFVSFNLYLEARQDLEAYVARLHNIAGDRPLVMAEVGLDAIRHGETRQAEALAWQVQSIFRGGCAGAFVFAWTDQWHRGGLDIEDWQFGLTTRDRRPRPALAAVARAFRDVPARPACGADLPGVSVVVCTHNGSRTIDDCLRGLARLEYGDYEVIVVDDGSIDRTAEIVRRHPDVRLIRTANQGLSAARNTGLRAARHAIVAYIDDDASPDPHWLSYLADTFARSDHAGVGGPNLPPDGFGAVADAVAMAPGGPVHVLLTDEVAEHIPGCNMAFRKERLEVIGGFDEQFRIAGDDVDVCWRLQDRGWTLGFNPAAVVWHRRRDTVRGYWKQQLNYGRAEADLERKWPEKYNAAGHLTWSGRLYSNGMQWVGWWARRRIYHGTWGSALFQSVYHVRPSWLWSLPAMPEWYLLVTLLAALSCLGPAWRPLYAALPLLVVALAAPATQAVLAARLAVNARPGARGARRLRLLWLTTFLHLAQPAARLFGRVGRGLTPWRRRGIGAGLALPRPRLVTAWSESWSPPERRLQDLEATLRGQGAVVARGGDFDRWDCEVRGGALGATRVRLLVEEHGRGRQLARFRVWPQASARGLALVAALAGTGAVAAVDAAPAAAAVFGAMALVLAARMAYECAASMATALGSLVASHAPASALPSPDAHPSPGTPGEGQGEGHSSDSVEKDPHPCPLPGYREREESQPCLSVGEDEDLRLAGGPQ